MGKRVDRVKTVVSESQMAQTIIEVWKKLFGKEPFKEQVSMVLAQNSLETANRNSMYNYNLGNITTGGKGAFDFYDDLQTSEQTSSGVWEKKNLKYRAYPSLEDGVTDYLKFLSGSPRYATAWQHILNPNPAEFSKALKKSNYYTANEAGYTKGLVSLYNQFNKSDPKKQVTTTLVSDKTTTPTSGKTTKQVYDDLFDNYIDKPKGSDMYSKVNVKSKPENLVVQPKVEDKNVEDVITDYLGMIAASEKSNKRMYKKFLPQNNVNIEIQSSDVVNSIEFARILSAVLDEELLSRSSTHVNNNNVMVVCSISGPVNDCLKIISELSKSVTDAFKLATIKIGGINIKTQCSINKTSSYNEISIHLADINYRKFLLKFL